MSKYLSEDVHDKKNRRHSIDKVSGRIHLGWKGGSYQICQGLWRCQSQGLGVEKWDEGRSKGTGSGVEDENGTDLIFCHQGNVERKETRSKERSTRWCEKRKSKKEILLKVRVEAAEDELNREVGKNVKVWESAKTWGGGRWKEAEKCGINNWSSRSPTLICKQWRFSLFYCGWIGSSISRLCCVDIIIINSDEMLRVKAKTSSTSTTSSVYNQSVFYDQSISRALILIEVSSCRQFVYDMFCSRCFNYFCDDLRTWMSVFIPLKATQEVVLGVSKNTSVCDITIVVLSYWTFLTPSGLTSLNECRLLPISTIYSSKIVSLVTVSASSSLDYWMRLSRTVTLNLIQRTCAYRNESYDSRLWNTKRCAWAFRSMLDLK